MGRAARTLTVARDSRLSRGLAALMAKEHSRSISVVGIDPIQWLASMKDAGLARIIHLLLSMLLEADFREWLPGAGDVSLVRWWHGSGHVRGVRVVDSVGAFTRVERGIQVLLGRVLAIVLLVLPVGHDDATRIVQGVVIDQRRRVVEVDRRVDCLLERQAHTLVK